MKSIVQRLAEVREGIRQLEQRYNRIPGAVTLLAVSKTKPLSDIRQAISEGQADYGENYLQEALDKIAELASDTPDSPVHWHFIGPVQSNKTRSIGESFDWLHSLDRLKIAQRLQDVRPDTMPPLNVCIQVNSSEESTKSGINPADLPEFAEAIANLPNLKLRGLMALPRPTRTLAEQRQECRKLSSLYEQLKTQGFELDTLSMGTSNDLEAAIAEGSTLVRVGTAIFGERTKKQATGEL